MYKTVSRSLTSSRYVMLLTGYAAAHQGWLPSESRQTSWPWWGARVRNTAIALVNVRRWLSRGRTSSFGGRSFGKCCWKQWSNDTAPCGNPQCIPRRWCPFGIQLWSWSNQVIVTCLTFSHFLSLFGRLIVSSKFFTLLFTKAYSNSDIHHQNHSTVVAAPVSIVNVSCSVSTYCTYFSSLWSRHLFLQSVAFWKCWMHIQDAPKSDHCHFSLQFSTGSCFAVQTFHGKECLCYWTCFLHTLIC